METFARRGDPGEEFGEGQPPGEGGGGLSPERGSRARSREGGVGRRARRGAVRSGEARATWGWRVCMCRGEKGLTRSHFCRRWAAGVSDCVVITPPSLARADTEAMDDLCRTDDVASLRSMGDTPLARQMLATMMRDLVQSFARRDADLRPARDALAAAEEKKRVGNDAFRAGDYPPRSRVRRGARAPGRGLSRADDVVRRRGPAPGPALQLRAVRAQGEQSRRRRQLLPRRAPAQRVHERRAGVQEDPRPPQAAHEALGEHDKAVAVVAEARIRGPPRRSSTRSSRACPPPSTAPRRRPPPNVEMRMFISSLALRGRGEPRAIPRPPPVRPAPARRPPRRGREQRPWGVLNALTIPDEKNDDDEKTKTRAAPTPPRSLGPQRRPRRRGERPHAGSAPRGRGPAAEVRGRPHAAHVRRGERIRPATRAPSSAPGRRPRRSRGQRRRRERVDRAPRRVRRRHPPPGRGRPGRAKMRRRRRLLWTVAAARTLSRWFASCSTRAPIRRRVTRTGTRRWWPRSTARAICARRCPARPRRRGGVARLLALRTTAG